MDKVCMECGGTPEEGDLVVIIDKRRRQMCKCLGCLVKQHTRGKPDELMPKK